MKRLLSALAALTFTAFAVCGVGAQTTIRVTGEILAYQSGYVFFTSGDGFRVSPSLVVTDAKTGGKTSLRPEPLIFARATFDASGQVVELDLSRSPLPAEGDFSQVQRFAVAISSPVPNPDLVQPTTNAPPEHAVTGTGRLVEVIFKVQVPAMTPINSQVYMTTDASGWNPQAIPMQRIDALHFSVVERLAVGTVIHYFYTRGSFTSEERGDGGLDVKPRTAVIVNVDEQAYNAVVYRWADDNPQGELMQPNVFPTPYNPAPFPNLPPGIHTPHP